MIITKPVLFNISFIKSMQMRINAIPKNLYQLLKPIIIKFKVSVMAVYSAFEDLLITLDIYIL